VPLTPHLRAAYIVYNISKEKATVFSRFFGWFGERAAKFLSKKAMIWTELAFLTTNG